MKVSIVIPCYNERATIEEVVKAIRAGPVQDIEIIVVDDGSTDGTKELLEQKPPGWVDSVILQERNQGKGAALRRRFRLPFPKRAAPSSGLFMAHSRQ